MERKPTVGRDEFLDHIIETNSQLKFKSENPYPSRTRNGEVNRRWADFNRYKSAKTVQQAFRRGATKSRLRQDLGKGLIGIPNAIDRALGMFTPFALQVVRDHTGSSLFEETAPDFAPGLKVQDEGKKGVYELTQMAADLPDELDGIVLSRMDQIKEARA